MDQSSRINFTATIIKNEKNRKRKGKEIRKGKRTKKEGVEEILTWTMAGKANSGNEIELDKWV